MLQRDEVSLAQERVAHGDIDGASRLLALLAAARPAPFRDALYTLCNLRSPTVPEATSGRLPPPGYRLMHAARRHLPPALALAEAGTTAYDVLTARVPILPGFTAESSALARELARRVSRSVPSPRLPSPSPDADLLNLSPSPATLNETLSQPPAPPADSDVPMDELPEDLDAPPSPQLLQNTLDLLSDSAAPPRPFGRARDWIDASGPQSLRALRLLNRLIWSARTGGPPAPDIPLPLMAAWVLQDSMGWPAEAWQGVPGRALNGRLARELRVSEVLGGFDTAASPPLAPPPLPPSCAARTRCAGPDIHHGYLCDEANRWWCDVCWAHAQLPAATTEEILPGTGQPLLSLRFSLVQVRLTSHFPSLTHFASSAREAGLLFRACDSMGGTFVGAARTLIFFARWLQPESLDLSPANLSGRMREWADILVTDLHRGDSTSLPVEPVPITVDQAHTLSLPLPPTAPAELATIPLHDLPSGARSAFLWRSAQGFL